MNELSLSKSSSFFKGINLFIIILHLIILSVLVVLLLILYYLRQTKGNRAFDDKEDLLRMISFIINNGFLVVYIGCDIFEDISD